jgi:hypothetical protein
MESFTTRHLILSNNLFMRIIGIQPHMVWTLEKPSFLFLHHSMNLNKLASKYD